MLSGKHSESSQSSFEDDLEYIRQIAKDAEAESKVTEAYIEQLLKGMRFLQITTIELYMRTHSFVLQEIKEDNEQYTRPFVEAVCNELGQEVWAFYLGDPKFDSDHEDAHAKEEGFVEKLLKKFKQTKRIERTAADFYHHIDRFIKAEKVEQHCTSELMEAACDKLKELTLALFFEFEGNLDKFQARYFTDDGELKAEQPSIELSPKAWSQIMLHNLNVLIRYLERTEDHKVRNVNITFIKGLLRETRMNMQIFFDNFLEKL